MNERCPEIITEFTSNQIFISELADPDNNSGARFVEIYNSSSEPLDLNLWTLRRYTNDNTEISSTIDLSGTIINGQSTLVISPNASEFELVYGFPPDIGVSTNSPADSNGDDNLQLVDPFGTVIDVFGIIGEDGSGTNHEFEDGRALRNPNITQGNPNYTFSEWTIFNDTGDAGTTKQPQNAPEDFTPGIRN
ncbi:MAG: lamin tail domain-containing protein [Bacteroidota bacterium]